MAHVHDVHDQGYYLDQLCTIGLSGAVAAVGILMWYRDLLQYILAGQFHVLVLAGSVGLLVLVVIRAVALWKAVGQAKPASHNHDHGHSHDHHDHHHHDHPHSHEHGHHHHHDHDHPHEHGPGCAHDHDHEHQHDHACGHDHQHEEKAAGTCCAEHGHGHMHDHDHDHGWMPARYVLVIVPIALYLCGLPNQGFSPDRWKEAIAKDLPADIDPQQLASVGDAVIPLDFTELKQAAFLPGQRAYYEGKMGRLVGQFMAGSTPNTCSLIRVKMVCCAADATMLNVVVIAPEKLPDFKALDWIQVEGQIQFRKRRDRDEYVPVLQLAGLDKITPTKQPKDAN